MFYSIENKNNWYKIFSILSLYHVHKNLSLLSNSKQFTQLFPTTVLCHSDAVSAKIQIQISIETRIDWVIFVRPWALSWLWYTKWSLEVSRYILLPRNYEPLCFKKSCTQHSEASLVPIEKKSIVYLRATAFRCTATVIRKIMTNFVFFCTRHKLH